MQGTPLLRDHAKLEQYYLLGILAFAFLLFFPGLGARDFWTPVEPRYGEIVRIMFAKGEWIVPTVNGDLYTDKPILFFWIALGAAKLLGGVNEWTIRFPAALGGVGFVMSTYIFGRDFFNARVGVISAVVLATAYRVIWESRWAHIDMLFGAFFVLSVYFGARTLLRRGGPNEILLAYVFMALGTLAKGLIGLVLPGLLFTAVMLTYRDWSMFRRAKPVLGVAIILFITVPWVFLVSKATDGKWLRDFIYVHHFLRYTDGAGHRRPLFYYFTTLPVDFLPWTVVAIPAVIGGACRENLRRPHVQLCLLWFLTIFVFFSLSDTKRQLYLLPLMPTLALLVGNYINSVSYGQLRESVLLRTAMAAFFGMVALAGLTAPVIAWFWWPDAVWPSIPVSLVLFAGGILTAALMLRGRVFAASGSLSVMMLFVTFAVVLRIFPYLERYKSDREFAQEVVRLVPRQAALYVYRDNMHDLNFYTKREEIPVLTSPGEIVGLSATPQKNYVLISEREWKRVLDLLPDWTVIATESKDWRLIEGRSVATLSRGIP